MDCVFCEILAGRSEATIVFEDADTIAMLDINPAAEGHTLVLPRSHVADIWDADPVTVAAVAATVHTVAQMIRDRDKPDGLTIFQANRQAGWQDVFHLHVHLVSRFDGDSLVPPWS